MPADRSPPQDDGLVFNVSTLWMEPLGSTREYPLANAPFSFDEGRCPVSGLVLLTRTDGSVLVEAELTLAVEEICGRCLDSFQQSLTVELAEEFWPEYDPLSQQRVEIPEGREGFPIVDSVLDLQEPLRQYVEMERPMQPVCRAACPGPHDAPRMDEQSIDHRWDALEELRRELR